MCIHIYIYIYIYRADSPDQPQLKTQTCIFVCMRIEQHISINHIGVA